MSDKPIEIEFLIELAELLKREGIETSLFDSQARGIQQAKKLLEEKGTSYVLSLVELREAVLPRADIDTRPLLIKTVNTQLAKLSPKDSLIIVDPYFFVEKDIDGYLEVFGSIFDSVVSSIREITFITKPNFNTVLVAEVRTKLLNVNAQLTVSHKTTDIFHDRFWIVDQDRGMFVGTSINGIGKRYALTDYIRSDDVKEIMQELRRNQLL